MEEGSSSDADGTAAPAGGQQRINVLEIIGNGIVGGMESYVRNLIRLLPANQFRVTCLCPYESAFTVALRRMNCTVYITPVTDDPTWRAIQMAVEIVRSQNINLIHAHLPNAHVLAGIAGRLTKTPALATVHGMNVSTLELSVSRITETPLIVVCQEAYAQALATSIPLERLTLIPNGVDTETFRPDVSGEAFRQMINVPPGVPLVGFVGRLAWEKGPDKFLRVAERVHEQRPDVHFAMVGEGPMEDKINLMLKRMRLSDYVHTVGLMTDTWNIYPAFDLLAQTSRHEGMPLTLLEAMACARPVVAIGVGGVAELVEHGTSGLIISPREGAGLMNKFPDNDWEGIASAVLALLARPAQLERMGRAGRRRVEELFDVRTSAKMTAELFQRLAHTYAPRRALALSEYAARRSEASPARKRLTKSE
jgi:glycosyltransferase involved in cell wall biosynthesis